MMGKLTWECKSGSPYEARRTSAAICDIARRFFCGGCVGVLTALLLRHRSRNSNSRSGPAFGWRGVPDEVAARIVDGGPDISWRFVFWNDHHCQGASRGLPWRFVGTPAINARKVASLLR